MASRMVFIAGIAWALAVPVAWGGPIDYVEGWDAYGPGEGGAGYVANWDTLAGANRYPVDDNGGHVNSGARSLKVKRA